MIPELLNLLVKRGDLNGVQALMREGVQPADKKFTDFPLLINAIDSGNKNLIKLLAQHGVSTYQLYDIQTVCINYGLEQITPLIIDTPVWEFLRMQFTYTERISGRVKLKNIDFLLEEIDQGTFNKDTQHSIVLDHGAKEYSLLELAIMESEIKLYQKLLEKNIFYSKRLQHVFFLTWDEKKYRYG